jgi:hypothetical protein
MDFFFCSFMLQKHVYHVRNKDAGTCNETIELYGVSSETTSRQSIYLHINERLCTFTGKHTLVMYDGECEYRLIEQRLIAMPFIIRTLCLK